MVSNLFGKLIAAGLCLVSIAFSADHTIPYQQGCTQREDVFAFTQKPKVKHLGHDKYEITFAAKGYCDVTVGLVDKNKKVVRHLGSGVLGKNVPAPFQKNSLQQKIYWDGKDDLGAYVKHPKSLRVRVMLGLKPVFDKRIGGTSPKNLPGLVLGMVIGPKVAYVFCQGTHLGFGHGLIRTFDRDGKYIRSITPPSPDMPDNKQAGMGYVDYQNGKRSIQGPWLNAGKADNRFHLPALNGNEVTTLQPVLVGNRLVFANAGQKRGSHARSTLHYIYTDGSTDVAGVKGFPLAGGEHREPRLAASPDGKRIYFSRVKRTSQPNMCVYVRTLSGKKSAKVFAGVLKKPGADNKHFNNAKGIACDADGRVYVADCGNNRIQVFSGDGAFLKTIKIERPDQICLHQKTGAIYVQHLAHKKGRTVLRLTKLTSFGNPKEAFHVDGLSGLMVLDSWSARPRLWLSGKMTIPNFWAAKTLGAGSLTIWEEQGQGFKKIVDFEDDAIKAAGKKWLGRWAGVGGFTAGGMFKTFCDPTRGKLYYLGQVFDLKSGQREGRWAANSKGAGASDDFVFDKSGYLHGHQSCRAPEPCIWRVDPSSAFKGKDHANREVMKYPERLYDYGVARKSTWKGALPVKDQYGAKGFQDGLGVNMRGDVAVASNISYVPKMGHLGDEYAMGGAGEMTAAGRFMGDAGLRYSAFLRDIQERMKKGEEVYSIRRRPGSPLVGGTIWVFDRSGELRTQEPVVVGGVLNGVQMDKDASIYFVTNRARLIGGKQFLAGKSGRIGIADDKKNRTMFTGTYIKTRGKTFRILQEKAPIALDEFPKRPFDMIGTAKSGKNMWVEGAEWIYAGVSPVAQLQPCSCPQLRVHLDWYKRSFVPEAYRYSIGILDANSNLIMHLGRYANFDSAPGGQDGTKPGGTDIGITCARYIGGTDDYITFEDWGERIVVLKLEYHADETVAINLD